MSSNAKGQEQKYELFAMDPDRIDSHLVAVTHQIAVDRGRVRGDGDATGRNRPGSVQVPESDVDVEIEIDQLSELDPDTPMQPIAGTPYPSEWFASTTIW